LVAELPHLVELEEHGGVVHGGNRWRNRSTGEILGREEINPGEKPRESVSLIPNVSNQEGSGDQK
jgi:hypothetical protein